LVVADIFISYSQQDRDEARLIAAFLEAEAIRSGGIRAS
jgi:hypothetical protein